MRNGDILSGDDDDDDDDDDMDRKNNIFAWLGFLYKIPNRRGNKLSPR